MEKTDESTKFTPRQLLICVLCFGAYLCAYLIRVNISIALPEIRELFQLVDEQDPLKTVENPFVGMIPGAFFWTYAIGQLVSGWLGDRISPKYMIGIGLSVSAAINIAFSFTNSLTVMVVLWGLNGVFQSMLWAPIMRTIVLNFEGKSLAKMTFAMSLTLVFGYSISWSASTLINNFIGWRFMFVIPAVVAVAFVIVWFVLYKKENERNLTADGNKPAKLSTLKSVKYLPQTVALILIACMLHGVIKESINTWLPTILKSVGSFSLSSTLGVLIVVPIVNFLGILLMKFILSRGKANNYSTSLVLMGISLIVAAAAFFAGGLNAVVLVCLTVALSGLMFAVNPVYTAYIPLDFAKWNCVSTVAGLIDCLIYIGAAFSGILTGFLADGSDWSSVTLMWLIVLAAAVAVSLALKVVATKFISNSK